MSRLIIGLTIITLTLSALIACSSNRSAQLGDTVKVEFQGIRADGTVFDSTADNSPIQFVIGNREVLPGFETALIGMKPGDTKNIVLQPDQAYGVRRDEYIRPVAKTDLPPDMELQIGTELLMGGQPDGSKIPVRIIEIRDDSVVLDANHYLAGETLTFDVTLVEIL